MRELAADIEPASYETLKHYVLEASRFQSTFPNTRVCQSESCQVKDSKGQDVTVKKGDVVVADHVSRPEPCPYICLLAIYYRC